MRAVLRTHYSSVMRLHTVKLVLPRQVARVLAWFRIYQIGVMRAVAKEWRVMLDAMLADDLACLMLKSIQGTYKSVALAQPCKERCASTEDYRNALEIADQMQRWRGSRSSYRPAVTGQPLFSVCYDTEGHVKYLRGSWNPEFLNFRRSVLVTHAASSVPSRRRHHIQLLVRSRSVPRDIHMII